MTISSTLAARLSSVREDAPARRWSPYSRPTSHGRHGGAAEPPRSPRCLNPATKRLLGPAEQAAPSQQVRRSEVAASFAAAAASPARRRPGRKMTKQEPKQDPNFSEGDEKPLAEDKCSGGFVYHCTLAGHTEAISGISLPLGSDKLYSGSADGSVSVWDCNSGKCVDVIKMGSKIGCMITHGPWVFIGISKSVEVWNTQTGLKLSLRGPSGLVCSMAITKEMLFAGTGDGRIMAWNFPSKEISVEPVAILNGHERPVISLSISATSLFSASLDKTIKVWDLTTLQCIQTLSEHKAAVTSVLCWDKKLLSCSLDKTVKVWTLSESGNLQVQHTHSEEHGLRTLFGMHRVGKTPVLLYSLRNGNGIRLYDLPSFDQMGTLFCKTEVRTIELASVGLLFTGDCAGELKVWRWAPQEQKEASEAPQESTL